MKHKTQDLSSYWLNEKRWLTYWPTYNFLKREFDKYLLENKKVRLDKMFNNRNYFVVKFFIEYLNVLIENGHITSNLTISEYHINKLLDEWRYTGYYQNYPKYVYLQDINYPRKYKIKKLLSEPQQKDTFKTLY